MGLILCFSSAAFSLRRRFKTNRLSVGTVWKWFQWGFVQPSSHHCTQSIHVPSASKVLAGGVGGSDRRRGSRLCWLGFWEAAHHVHHSATAYSASSNNTRSQSHHLPPLPCQWSSECAVTGNYRITLPQMDSAYSAIWKKEKKLKWNKNNSTDIVSHSFTYCCTQGIYIYSPTRNRCWVIEKLEPSIVLLTCHHREICFNLL